MATYYYTHQYLKIAIRHQLKIPVWYDFVLYPTHEHHHDIMLLQVPQWDASVKVVVADYYSDPVELAHHYVQRAHNFLWNFL